jgi:hypothetical protein
MFKRWSIFNEGFIEEFNNICNSKKYDKMFNNCNLTSKIVNSQSFSHRYLICINIIWVSACLPKTIF